ncbi:MAG: YkgJ family cysteine cluster protein, partial [Planctomycetaceae bacterium]|nr:YkgJ family cysteine cluster protein [Planctomycetaceae bacterium]
MSGPVLSLPTIQNWSCQNCSGCCRQHAIYITPEEKQRIESQRWENSNEIPRGQLIFQTERPLGGPTRVRLAHQPDGACVFLDEQGLCRIHAKFGEDAKPLACRIYPYAIHPAGDKLAVGLRFSCPSVARNQGRSVASQKKGLMEIARAVAPANYQTISAPATTQKTVLSWKDTLRIADALDQTLQPGDVPVSVKLARALFWMELVGQSHFEKIRGDQISELLALLTGASAVEVPDRPDAAPPNKISQTQFRLLAGQYARKDTEATMDRSVSGRLRQLRVAWRLASGKGMAIPPQPELHEVSFEDLEQPLGGLDSQSEEMLTRYYRVKIQSLHFFGAAYYSIPLVEGFQSLAATFPAILWIARWHAVSHSRKSVTHDDVVWALTVVDHQHGYSPIFGTWGFRRRIRNL